MKKDNMINAMLCAGGLLMIIDGGLLVVVLFNLHPNVDWVVFFLKVSLIAACFGIGFWAGTLSD